MAAGLIGDIFIGDVLSPIKTLVNSGVLSAPSWKFCSNESVIRLPYGITLVGRKVDSLDLSGDVVH
jgi:hypothetical protein